SWRARGRTPGPCPTSAIAERAQLRLTRPFVDTPGGGCFRGKEGAETAEVAKAALRAPLLGARRGSPLDAIPGSTSFFELAHLPGDVRRFFHERFARYGRVWKSRFVYPVVFLIGEEANKSVLVTRRSELSFGLGYAQTAVKRIFEGSIMLQDGEAHDRTR